MPNITSNEIFVFSEAELLTKIHDFVENEKFHDLHIMAGHFMLFYDNQKNKLVPGIFEDINSTPLKEKIRSRIGIFPSYSWHLGVQLAEHHISKNQKSANLLLLINDWQYVPDKESNYDYRAEFYSSFTELPPTYISRLQSSNIVSTKNIIASRRHPISFPETWLKNRFQNEAVRLVKKGKLQKKYISSHPTMSEISFTDASGATLPLVSCGMTGCAGEITEMISEAYKSGARLLVLLAPNECHEPIRKGVEIALSLYNFEAVSILVADLGGSGELNIEEIYSKGIHVVTYET